MEEGGEDVKSCRCLCWRFDKQNIGLFRPGFFREKIEKFEKSLFLCGGSLFLSIVGAAISYGIFSYMGNGMALVGTMIGGVGTCLCYILSYVCVNRNRERLIKEKNGPWWSRENIGKYKKRKKNKSKKKLTEIKETIIEVAAVEEINKSNKSNKSSKSHISYDYYSDV